MYIPDHLVHDHSNSVKVHYLQNSSDTDYSHDVSLDPDNIMPPDAKREFQRKGRLPQHNHNRLVELQDKFDELEQKGVFVQRESVGVSVEYVNPSFLVNKTNGGTRLVTAFADVGRYSKP